MIYIFCLCRFMLQDVIDLRNSKWVPRRQDINPRTIDEIQKEASDEQLTIQVSFNVALSYKIVYTSAI